MSSNVTGTAAIPNPFILRSEWPLAGCYGDHNASIPGTENLGGIPTSIAGTRTDRALLTLPTAGFFGNLGSNALLVYLQCQTEVFSLTKPPIFNSPTNRSEKMRLPLLLFLAAGTLDNPAALRTKIEHIFHVPDPLPALAIEKHGAFEVEPGIVADRVTYNTQLNMRVPAVVYHPASTNTKRPAIIIVNGHGGDKYTWYAFYAGILYARAGAVVLTYDPIGEGERHIQHKDSTRAHDKYVPPDENARWMAGLMVTDIRQATSYLLQRSDVDPARIAMTGYSMGSFVTSWACAVETRVHACAPTAGAVLDEPGGTLDSSSKKMCQSIPYQSLQFLGDRGPAIFALAALHAAVLIHNGDADEVVNIPTHGEAFFRDLRDRTAKLLGPNASKVFTYSFTPEGGHRPYFITRPVAEWFNQQLHFPDWNAIAHDETHISEWAAKKNVPMDKQYATEHREGGAIALGKNIPGIPHDQLNVLPESEWQSKKENFILETWLERVRQASPSAH